MKKSALFFLLMAIILLTGYRNPPGALRYIEMGDKSVSEGDTAQALEYYSKAISIEPSNPTHYTVRGFLLLKLKRHDDAIQDFSASIQLEKDKPGGYLTRGLVNSELHRNKEADADFAEACRLGSKDGCSFAGK
jgi:tetratricopeptide (TPR) repeat protein